MRERLREAQVRHAHGRQHAVPQLHHQADHRARHRREELRYLGDHDLADRRARQDLLQLVGEEVHDHQRLGAGIAELVLHLGARVERIGVHQHAPGLEHPEGDHRVGEAVGRLQGDARASGEAQPLAQIGGEGVREPVHLAIGERAVHAVGHAGGEGNPLGVTRRRLAHKLRQV